MEKSLERCKLPKLPHEVIDNLNIPITSKETEFVIRRLPTVKNPDPDGFTGEFYQMFKELTSILLKLFKNKPFKNSTIIIHTNIP